MKLAKLTTLANNTHMLTHIIHVKMPIITFYSFLLQAQEGN